MRLAPLRTPAVLALVLASAAALVPACGPSEKKIQAWKASPDGAPRLGAVIKDPDLDLGLRAQAAAALVEIGAGDVMEAALAGLELPDRNRLATRIVPLLEPSLRSTDLARSGDSHEALYVLREQAPDGEARKAVDAVLVPALVADVKSGRDRVGRRNVRDILISLGPSIVPKLQALLDDPNIPFDTAVAVIDKVGDRAARTAGGGALVRRAQKITVMPEPLWDALATLGGGEVSKFLIEAVDKGPPAQAERAAKAMVALGADTPVGHYAIQRAGQATTTPALRETLFEVLEKNRPEPSRKELVELIGRTLDPAIRFRAYRAALKAAGGAVIPEALAAFPRGAAMTSEQVRNDLVAPISAMPGMDTRGPLFKAFESPAPLARLVALLAIEKMGFASDATHVAKLEKDQGTVKGLPPEDRVGRQAARIAAALRKISS